jgi:branched-chain amino acid transport system permease protein
MNRHIVAWLHSPWPIVCLLALLPFLVNDTALVVQSTTILSFALLALGLHVVVGYTGALHLGIAAFFGIGAYSAGIFTTGNYPFQIGFVPGAIAATLMASLAGFILATPTLRLRGDYLAIVTLGFGEVVKVSLKNLENITGGKQTLDLIPRPIEATAATPELGIYYTSLMMYFVAFLLVVLAVAMLLNLERSRLGRAWVAIREDELAATSMGVKNTQAKLIAFALGSALAGLAGAVYVTNLTNTSDPDSTYDFNTSIITLCCLILGGLGGIRGTLLGVLLLQGLDAILIPRLDEFLASASPNLPEIAKLKSWRLMVFGLSLILMMRFRPEGILPARRMQLELHDTDDTPHESYEKELQKPTPTG